LWSTAADRKVLTESPEKKELPATSKRNCGKGVENNDLLGRKRNAASNEAG